VTERLDPRAFWALLGTLGALVAVNVPILGSDPWPFHPLSVRAHGLLGPIVRAADDEWDLGTIRTPAVLAGLLVALAALVAVRGRPVRTDLAVALTSVVCALLLVPAVLLQIGLRDASAPWYHVNDSTYQMELAGDLLLDGKNPYGHDYDGSGLERFYEAAGVQSEREQVALTHFAYFPGAAITAAAWRLLPAPLDDYRLFVLLATLASLAAVLLVRAPTEWRLAIAAAVVANPLAVRAAWFGTADAPSLLCLLLTFAFVTRRQPTAAAASLAAAVLLKQFAIVAVPFVALMLLARATRDELRRAAIVFGASVAVGVLPFLVADPGAFWRDTVSYGSSTYRIIGYGLSALLLHAGLVDDRYSSYPFVPIALVAWLPATIWLLWHQHRARALWTGAAGFAVSIFLLLFVARVFQNSYLIWPFVGIAVAALLAAAEQARAGEPARPAPP
jgi:Glycosyltransferase family 87